MRIRPFPSLLLAACALDFAAKPTFSFISPSVSLQRVSSSARIVSYELSAETVRKEDCECVSSDSGDGLLADSLVDQKGSAQLFRSLTLTDANGENIRLGERMGEGKSVVIFLRHLG